MQSSSIDLDSLAAVVARLDAREQIQDLLSRYANCVDYGREAEYLDLFAEDGLFEATFPEGFDVTSFPPRGGEIVDGALRHTGRAQLASLIGGHTRAPFVLHRHLALHPLIVVDGDGATCESAFLRFDVGVDAAVYVRAMGRYLDRLRRCADGRWRFVSRRLEIQFLDTRAYRVWRDGGPGQ